MSNYYVSNAGDDANAGTSELVPWEYSPSMPSASGVSNAHTRVAGDKFLFNRGDTWTERIGLTGIDGTAVNRITYDAYGTGALPIIDMRKLIPGWDTAENWTEPGGGGTDKWRFDLDNAGVNTSVIGRIWLDDVEALRSEDAAALDTTYNYTPISGTPNYLWVFSTENPATAFSTNGVKASNISASYIHAFRLSSSDYITIRHLDLRGGNMGLRIVGDAAYAIIEDCDIGMYSTQGVEVDSTGGYEIIRNNIFDSGWPDIRYTHELAAWMFDAIIILNGSNNKIYGNTTLNWAHSGIGLDPSTGDTVSDNIMYDNDISAPHTDYSRGFYMGGTSPGVCDSNHFYKNTVRDTSVRNQIAGTNNRIYSNLIYNIRRTVTGGSWSDAEYDKSQGLSLAAGTQTATGNHLYNNALANIAEEGFRLHALTIRDNSGNFLENNICFDCGDDSFGGTTPFSLTVLDNALIASNTMSNNLFYHSDRGIGADEVEYRGADYTVAEFEANVSDGDVAADNLNLDPLFIDAANNNYHLKKTSPCRNKGTDVGLTQDYNGRQVHQPSDIGAYEIVGKLTPLEFIKQLQCN